MIVPQDRLLFWTAGGILPLLTLAAAFPETAPPALTVLALLLGWIGVDAVRSRRHPRQFTVESPGIIRLARGRPGIIPLHLTWTGSGSRRARIALALAGGVQTETITMAVALTANAPEVDVAWPVTGCQTGRYPLEHLYLEMDSCHRFWAIRRALPVRSELRIFPNLQTEYRLLKGATFRRLSGLHTQRQIGKGREFEQLREYQPGDGYEDIHWRATAKFGHPVTKVFQVERTQEVYVVLDASRLSGRIPTEVNNGTERGIPELRPPTLIERYVVAALGLGVAAGQQGDLFGCLTFSDRVTRFLRAGSGKTHFHTCLESLYTLKPEPVAPDFNALFAFIATHIRRRALIIFLTSLDDPVLAENFAAHADMIRRQHLVLVNMIRPPGAQPLFADDAVNSVAGIRQALAGHHSWQHLRETRRKLQHLGIRLTPMENERLSLQVISQYLEVKQRQVL